VTMSLTCRGFHLVTTTDGRRLRVER
jgi:hypothetical protein